MFLPKYGIKKYHLLPLHYNLNEIPSFYHYSKIKFNNSMYSQFVQVCYSFKAINLSILLNNML